MKSFKVHTKEAVSLERNIRLQHVEDLLISEGTTGLKKIFQILKSIINQLVGLEGEKIQLKVKFDGAPAILFGIHPENKKFFVGTKSIFNKLNPKINYTNENIDKNHEAEGLRHKLKVALKYLPELEPKGIYQADILYTQEDLKIKVIDGVKYVIFKANTITYAVPANSKLAARILASEIGIIIHTEYKGTTFKNIKANLKVDISDLKKTPNVWFKDADYANVSKELPMEKDDSEWFKIKLQELEQLKDNIDNTFLDKIIFNSDISEMLYAYTNYLVRKGDVKKPANKKYDMFLEYITEKLQGEKYTLKTTKGQEKKEKKEKDLIKTVEDNKEQFIRYFKFVNLVTDIKLKILGILNILNELNTFMEKDGEYSPTEQEGFVALTGNGDVVKLINRDMFSRNNFINPKDWK